MPNLNGKTEFEKFKFWMWRNKKRERKICELVDKYDNREEVEIPDHKKTHSYVQKF